MEVYFIDTENVATRWVECLPTIKTGSKILMFYTTASPSLSMVHLSKIFKVTKDLEFIQCKAGHNALDFQLVTELGSRVARNSKNKYVIVSGDTGFNAVVDYWRQRDIDVSRMGAPVPVKTGTATILAPGSTAPSKPTKAVPEKKETGYEYICKDACITAPDDDVVVKIIVEAMQKPQNQRLSHVYSEMCSKFGQKRGQKMYSKISNAIKRAQPIPQTDTLNINKPTVPASASVVESPVLGYALICKKANINGEEADKITAFITTAMEKPMNQRRSDVYHKMCSEFGQARGLALYRHIKDMLQKVVENGLESLV